MAKNWLEKSRNAWENLGVNQSNMMFDEKTFKEELQKVSRFKEVIR